MHFYQKLQRFHLHKNEQNMAALRAELTARELPFIPEGIPGTKPTGKKALKNLLKEDEMRRRPGGNSEKHFKPLTRYENFKWLKSHFD